ncbi:MAG TPA: FAD-dependent oxidoreductase [Desulfocapsa sulfexigens]|nr:FAD-dependent oxidoreductase [Desulfocapsa sulfexigens]
MTDIIKHEICDVAIIGGGPAGLGAAIELKKNGISRVVVLDRETEAGGIPRHCGHPPFGISEFKRVLTGPTYANRIVQSSIDAGVEIFPKTTVTSLGREGRLSLISPEGIIELKAKRVLVATGTRETPRSARKVSGQRAMGICNTGALQAMVYLKNSIPFRNPVLVGTEIVSFSALFTCRKAGIKPVAMLEENSRPTVMWPISFAAKVFRTPLLLNTSIVDILGKERVNAVRISNNNGIEKEIACDGVLFTGQFTPESSLVRMSHLKINKVTGEPIVDEHGRCSDPIYYAVGNVVFRPVKVAGRCWSAGRSTAQWITKDLLENSL